jgi:hypothetical protein
MWDPHDDDCEEYCLLGCNAMKMEVIYYSETFICLRITRCYNPEHSTHKITIYINSEVQAMSSTDQQLSFLRHFLQTSQKRLLSWSPAFNCIIPERKMIFYLLEKFSLSYNSYCQLIVSVANNGYRIGWLDLLTYSSMNFLNHNLL